MVQISYRRGLRDGVVFLCHTNFFRSALVVHFVISVFVAPSPSVRPFSARIVSAFRIRIRLLVPDRPECLVDTS